MVSVSILCLRLTYDAGLSIFKSLASTAVIVLSKESRLLGRFATYADETLVFAHSLVLLRRSISFKTSFSNSAGSRSTSGAVAISDFEVFFSALRREGCSSPLLILSHMFAAAVCAESYAVVVGSAFGEFRVTVRTAFGDTNPG